MRLTSDRIISIDAFRGMTILTMVFVNELAGVSGMPPWMKHMPADADAMTFVDAVFPAFLFIVGMSIPFALNSRILRGDSLPIVQMHILSRTLGLLVLGVFMVNTEGGYHDENMPVSIHLWSLLFCVCTILTWNVYTFRQTGVKWLLRMAGIAGLVILAFIYRGGETGTEHMTPQWWGILGLIGWAYLISCVLFQLFRRNIGALLILTGICIAYYAVGHSGWAKNSASLHFLLSQGGHASHTSIVLCGIILTLIFFDESKERSQNRRFAESFLFALLLFAAGYFLRPYYFVSKIYATPSWCLYSSGFCVLLFAALYWVTDVKKMGTWTAFFRPAASNPLLTYLLPFIIYHAMRLLHLSLPDILREGLPGLLWSLVYAVLIMGLAMALNKLKIRLQL